MKLYALHDKKARAFTNFAVERSDTVASRHFAEAVLQDGSMLGKYAADFELVSLCDVSQDYEGLFPDSVPVGLAQPLVVITAEQVLASQPAKQQLELVKEA